jgi:putative transposase
VLRHLKTGGRQDGPAPEVLYGRRKMTAWLARNGFPGISRHTVDRLMRQEGINGLVRGRRTRTTIPAKDGVRAGDLLDRRFRTAAPNRAWVTDFTYWVQLLVRCRAVARVRVMACADSESVSTVVSHRCT